MQNLNCACAYYDTAEHNIKIELRMRLLQYGDRLRHIELWTQYQLNDSNPKRLLIHRRYL